MSKPLSGKHAVVTGGARGIGAAVSRELARLGATVSVMGRERARLEQFAGALAEEFKQPAAFFEVDVARAKSVEENFRACHKQNGSIDILVNNAGISESAPFLKTSTESWSRMLEVNLNGVFYCTRQVLAPMVERGFGRIVNIASTAGLRGYRYVAAYCASKHGVIGLTRALALELTGKGVTVNSICPGFTNTDLLKNSIANVAAKSGRSIEAVRAEFLKDSRSGRFVEPEEIAIKVGWLCLTEQAGINGQELVIEG